MNDFEKAYKDSQTRAQLHNAQQRGKTRTHINPPKTKNNAAESAPARLQPGVQGVPALEEQLSDLCQRIYQQGEKHIKPLPPWVIVRILPKEQKVGEIWLADTAQQKTLYEAIVLETWAPYEECRFKYTDEGKGEIIKERVFIQHECAVQVGQRVCFAHYEGLPVPYMDEKYYRMIRESVDQKKNPYMGVTGIIDYEGDKEVTKKIRDLMQSLYSVTISGVAASKGNVD